MKIDFPYVKAFIQLIYPPLCEACQNEIRAKNSPFCVPCLCDLPFTNMENYKENLFRLHFDGRVDLEWCASMFYLNRGGVVEGMLHRLKYQKRPDIAYNLGRFYGRILKENIYIKDIDGLIPVPLHPRKERNRGYNQSERIAAGIQKELHIPLEKKLIIRKVYTDTQTKMNRIERLQNTAQAFQLSNKEEFENQHLLLVDDVLTTGATLEACARELLKIRNIRLSMLTIALAI